MVVIVIVIVLVLVLVMVMVMVIVIVGALVVVTVIARVVVIVMIVIRNIDVILLLIIITMTIILIILIIIIGSKTRHALLSPPRKVYRLRLEGCRAQMKAEVVKRPAGAVDSRCCIKSGHIGMHGKVWQAWVKRQILHICV